MQAMLGLLHLHVLLVMVMVIMHQHKGLQDPWMRQVLAGMQLLAQVAVP
jgi:hypothetical protein